MHGLAIIQVLKLLKIFMNLNQNLIYDILNALMYLFFNPQFCLFNYVNINNILIIFYILK
jgi:hypothetical protein